MWLRYHPALHISLWVKDHTDPDTTDAQRQQHQDIHFPLMRPTSGLGPDSNTRRTLNLYKVIKALTDLPHRNTCPAHLHK